MPLIRGDLYRLYFCFQSMLSYLLRFLPREERIHWKIWQENGTIVSELSGYFPAQTETKPADLERVYRVSKTLVELRWKGLDETLC